MDESGFSHFEDHNENNFRSRLLDIAERVENQNDLDSQPEELLAEHYELALQLQEILTSQSSTDLSSESQASPLQRIARGTLYNLNLSSTIRTLYLPLASFLGDSEEFHRRDEYLKSLPAYSEIPPAINRENATDDKSLFLQAEEIIHQKIDQALNQPDERTDRRRRAADIDEIITSLTQLAKGYAAVSDVESARRALGQAEQIYQENTEVEYWGDNEQHLAEAALAIGDNENNSISIRRLRNAIAEEPHNDNWEIFLRLITEDGFPELAEGLIPEITTFNKQYDYEIGFTFEYFRALASSKNREVADQAISRAENLIEGLDDSPNLANIDDNLVNDKQQAFCRLAVAKHRLGDSTGAEQALQKARNIYENGNPYYHEYWQSQLIRAYTECGKLDEAMQIYSDYGSIHQYSRDEDLPTIIGVALLDAERLEDAESIFESRRWRDSDKYYVARAKYFARRGDQQKTDEALNDIEQTGSRIEALCNCARLRQDPGRSRHFHFVLDQKLAIDCVLARGLAITPELQRLAAERITSLSDFLQEDFPRLGEDDQAHYRKYFSEIYEHLVQPEEPEVSEIPSGEQEPVKSKKNRFLALLRRLIVEE